MVTPKAEAERILGALEYCLDSAAYFTPQDPGKAWEYIEVAQRHRRALQALISRGSDTLGHAPPPGRDAPESTPKAEASRRLPFVALQALSSK